MKLAVLSRTTNLYSTRRLLEAARGRGHDTDVLNTLRFSIDLRSQQPDLYYRGEKVDAFDAVLPRIGASITYFGTAVVRQFEQMDVFCANSSSGILNSRDKLRSLQGGDLLLCFGKLDSMRHLVPARVRQRRRPQVGELS